MRLLLFLLVFGMVINNAGGQNEQQDTSFRVHAAVEEKARLLQDNNQDTYRALADEIFKAAHGFGVMSVVHGIGPTKIPAPLDNVIKDRLVFAEMQYRQGRGKGVSEQSIVDFTNMLGQKLNLPDYAQTSPAQVRHIRMWLISVNPTLMGRGAARPNMHEGESISSELSPLQATHLLLEVMGHKLFDPYFQLTPAEWDRDREQRETQRNAQLSAGSVPSPPIQQVVHMTNPKGDEMRLAVAQAVNAMSPTDAFSLIDKGFEILGIGR
jgi:hypothetical protein